MKYTDITHPEIKKASLVALAKGIPGAWIEDCCDASDTRGAKARLDCLCIRPEPDEPKSLDPCGKCSGDRSFKGEAEAWASFPINPADSTAGGTALGAVSPGFWAKPSSLGWTNFSGAFEVPV